MIPVLYYDVPTSGTSSLGLGRLNEAISGACRRVLNGVDEIELTYPANGKRAANLEVSRIVLAQPEYGRDPQPYRIYDILNQTSGIIHVYARHIKEQASYIPVMPFSIENATPDEIFEEMTGYLAELDNPFDFYTNINSQNTFHLKTPASMANCLAGMEGSLLDLFGGEYDYDFYTIRLLRQRGSDNGVTLRYGKNITNLKREENIDGTVTGIVPFWADMNGNLVTLSEQVIRSSKTALYPFNRTVVKDASESFENQPTEAQLRAWATAYMSKTGIDDPEIQMDINFEHLNQYEEFRNSPVLETVNLGDTVKIIYDHQMQVNASARIVETQYDFLSEKYKKVSIGRVKYNLIDVLNGK